MRNLSSRARLVVTAVACIVLLAFVVPAQARTAPVTLSFSGTFAAPTIISTQPLLGFTTDHLTGNGAPLGHFTALYPHVVNFDNATFTGVAVFTASGGDRLVVQLGGSGIPTSPTTFAVTYSGPILGGTGRFDDASGSVSGPGIVDLANLTVSATLTGTIKLH
jgi:hypothetical protein